MVESPVLVWREHRAMKAPQLAAAANLDPARLAAIEEGHRAASPGDRVALARALAVDAKDLARFVA